MLKVLVVERTGEARGRAHEFIQGLVPNEASSLEYVPRIDLCACSPEELRFRDSPEILIIGPSIINEDMVQAGALRKLHPSAACIAILPARRADLSSVEHLARMGIDDVVSPGIDPADFQRRLVLLARRIARPKTGKLVLVESAKGGVGVTSMVAALADAAMQEGNKVCVVDLDFETQDLSRFLQARPFVSEAVQQLLDGERAISSEYIDQACVPVQIGEGELSCVPPPPETDAMHESRGEISRRLVGITEALDTEHDLVFIDAGACHGNMLRVLERVSDVVVCLVSNDPAALYASLEKIRKVRAQMTPTARLLVLENAAVGTGLDHSLLREEFKRLAGLEAHEWETPVPYSKSATTWPGSGSTLFSLMSKAQRVSISKLLLSIGAPRQGEAALEVERVSKVGLLTRVFGKRGRVADAKLVELPSAPTLPLLGSDESKVVSLARQRHIKSQTNNDASVFKVLQISEGTGEALEAAGGEGAVREAKALISKASLV